MQQQYNPEITTAFEQLALRDDTVTKLAAWHETHVRGVDRRLWLSTELAQRLERQKLPSYAVVTDLGRGLRLQVPNDRRRAELEPLIAALGPLVPSEAEAARWTAARAAQLTQP